MFLLETNKLNAACRCFKRASGAEETGRRRRLRKTRRDDLCVCVCIYMNMISAVIAFSLAHVEHVSSRRNRFTKSSVIVAAPSHTASHILNSKMSARGATGRTSCSDVRNLFLYVSGRLRTWVRARLSFVFSYNKVSTGLMAASIGSSNIFISAVTGGRKISPVPTVSSQWRLQVPVL